MFVLEVGHHVCDLVRVFNTQACQLVLGAGAVRTAGLKSISAKHLALRCGCACLVVWEGRRDGSASVELCWGWRAC